MLKLTRVFVIALLVACISLVSSLTAYSAYIASGRYYFNYSNEQQRKWAVSLSYLDTSQCFMAALRSVANLQDNSALRINVYFKDLGATTTGKATITSAPVIYLNTVKLWDKLRWSAWGATLAHETSHVLFLQYTRAWKWNYSGSHANMIYYMAFLTESLAWYTGRMLCIYGDQYSAATVRANLKNEYSKTGKILSMYQTAYYYRNGGYSAQVQWQLMAQGYFFVQYLGNSRLGKLLYLLRQRSAVPGKYLLSTNYNTVRLSFETAFYKTYGKYCNAGGIYTTNYKDPKYLMGIFWANWYK
jgi:hypothetical protein